MPNDNCRRLQIKRTIKSACWACALSLVAGGCATTSLKTYPVSGKTEVKDGDASLLAGSHVELLHEGDENIRPSGKITSDGSYMLQTLHSGKILPGAPEGKYKARIILGDESDAGVPKRKGDPINKKYYDFATSGLSITVPGGDYNLLLSKK